MTVDNVIDFTAHMKTLRIDRPKADHEPFECAADATLVIDTLGLVESTGCSYRQADYWTRTHILTCHIDADGSGSQRLYPATEIAFVRRLLDLIDVGFNLRPAAYTARALTSDTVVVLSDRYYLVQVP